MRCIENSVKKSCKSSLLNAEYLTLLCHFQISRIFFSELKTKLIHTSSLTVINIVWDSLGLRSLFFLNNVLLKVFLIDSSTTFNLQEVQNVHSQPCQAGDDRYFLSKPCTIHWWQLRWQDSQIWPLRLAADILPGS